MVVVFPYYFPLIIFPLGWLLPFLFLYFVSSFGLNCY